MRGVSRAARGLSRRYSVHIPAAGELIRKAKDIAAAATGLSSNSYIAHIYPSRQSHTPRLKLTKGTTSHRFDLDIDAASLPAEVESRLAELGFDNSKDGAEVVQGMWEKWRKEDLLRLKGTLGHVDGSVTLEHISGLADPFASYRQPTLLSITDSLPPHHLEAQAAKANLFYHKSRRGGNIGCYGYGAGSAMSTMDVLAVVGGKPANFLDGGGGATEANVRAALDVITADEDVVVCFVNTFGGLTRTELIADGLVKFLRERKEAGKKTPPFVVRLRGTGENEARDIINAASDLDNIKYIPDLKEAATEATRLASSFPIITSSGAKEIQPTATLSPVVFNQDGQYEMTSSNIMVKEGAKVLIMGTGKASLFHNSIAQKFGTNIIGATSPNKAGQSFLSKPVFSSLREAQSEIKPEVVSVFVPAKLAADAIIECIEAEVPLIVAYAEGVPTHDQLRIQSVLRSQGKSRLIGANCPGMIIPHAKVKLGIQPLAVHSPGCVGLASRSGTISYELAAQTTSLGLGQSIVFGLGGDPFPGTRTHEALSLMLSDPHSKVICVIGEVGGQMEEEVAEVYKTYRASLPAGTTPKPVVGFVAGVNTERGLMYGHAGAIWWDAAETARSKKKCWEQAGIRVVETLGEVGGALMEEVKRVGAA